MFFPISLIKMSSLSFYTLDGTSDRKIYNLLLSKIHKWNFRSKMYHVQPPIKSYSRQQFYILRENEFPSRFLKSCYRFLSCYLLTCRSNKFFTNCYIFAIKSWFYRVTKFKIQPKYTQNSLEIYVVCTLSLWKKM